MKPPVSLGLVRVAIFNLAVDLSGKPTSVMGLQLGPIELGKGSRLDGWSWTVIPKSIRPEYAGVVKTAIDEIRARHPLVR